MLSMLTVGLVLVVKLECYYLNESFWPNYTWVPNDRTLDCVVAISDSYTTNNLGVLIGSNFVVTSELPHYSSFGYTSYTTIFTVGENFNKKIGYYVKHHIGDYTNKNYYMVYWGGDKYHNPLHDVMFMITVKDVEWWFGDERHPYYLPVARKHNIEEPSGWLTGAFALVDKDHVNHSINLISVYYDEPVLVDCDEYFPRYWGYFICIKNIDNYPVIQSGAPLIQNGILFGVASFTMKRGRESIYAFTDLREYEDAISQIHTKYWKALYYN